MGDKYIEVGEVGSMPGTSGFTMACFLAVDVPVGSKLYIVAPSNPVKVSNPIKESYHDGRCGDCGMLIPDDVVEGQTCDECGHAFFAETPCDD